MKVKSTSLILVGPLLLIVTVLSHAQFSFASEATTLKAVDPGILLIAKQFPKTALSNLKGYKVVSESARLVIGSPELSDQVKVVDIQQKTKSIMRSIQEAKKDFNSNWISLPLKAVEFVGIDHPFSKTEAYLQNLETTVDSISRYVIQKNYSAAQMQLDKVSKILSLYQSKISK